MTTQIEERQSIKQALRAKVASLEVENAKLLKLKNVNAAKERIEELERELQTFKDANFALQTELTALRADGARALDSPVSE